MGKREAEINITGNTADARQELDRLEREAKKAFSGMSDAAKKEADATTKAFRKSGLRTEKEIKKSTLVAQANFEKIKKSGVASANDIRRAHGVMTAKIKKNNRELASGNSNLLKSFTKVKGGLVAMGVKVVALGAIVAGAFGVKAVGEAIKFENALLDLQKVLSDSDGPVEQYGDRAKELALVVGVASSDVLQSAADFKQAGFDIEDAFLLTDASLKLVVASELEAAEASQLLIRTLNGFKAPASEADRLINILNSTSEKYATNITELGEGMKDISGLAKKAGFSFEETAGLLVPVISVFGSGSEAAQALKSGLLRLVSSQKPVVDELARLGIHQREVNDATGEFTGKLRSGKDILLDVSAAFQGMSENQKLVTTGILAGTLQAGKMSEVFDGMGLSIEVTNNALTDTDSINKEVATRLQGTGVQLGRLKTAFNDMAGELGTEVLPAVKGFVDVMIPFIQWLSSFGVRTILQIEKAWVEMSFSINVALGLMAKASDFLGVTSGAADVIAIDQEKLAAKLVAIDNRLVETSKESINKKKAKEAELTAVKAKEIEATAMQVAAADVRKSKLAEENNAMLQVAATLEKVIRLRQEDARVAAQEAEDFKKITFVGPLTQQGRTAPNLPGFNTGGAIPGYGGGDKVPILTEGGEHVIRKESVKKLGRGAAQAFNRGDIAGLINALPVQRFKEGGEVQGSSGPAANVNLIMNDKAFPVTAEQSVADEFIATIKSINTIHGRKKQIF